MKINYWDCEYCNYEEYWDGEEEERFYLCAHPKNEERYCHLDNKYADMKADCQLLDLAEV